MCSGLQEKLTSPLFLRGLKWGVKSVIFRKHAKLKKCIILELYSQTCFLASTYFRIFLPLLWAWHRSGLADDGRLAGGSVQQKKDSDHSSAALTAVSGRTECSITERDMKDEVPLVQSCSAEVQSNPEAEEMCLPSRGAADVPEPQWRIPYLRRQVRAASWLRRVTGTARCLLCSKGERRDLLYLGNDVMETPQRQIL